MPSGAGMLDQFFLVRKHQFGLAALHPLAADQVTGVAHVGLGEPVKPDFIAVNAVGPVLVGKRIFLAGNLNPTNADLDLAGVGFRARGIRFADV